MKTIDSCVVAVCLLALVGQAYGQDDRSKLRHDPTYSTHNYKHANKAATARRWEANSGVAVQPPKSGETNLANYKRQVPGQAPAGGVTVSHTPLTDVADRNYKMQRPNQATGAMGSGVVAKKKNRANNGTAIGD